MRLHRSYPLRGGAVRRARPLGSACRMLISHEPPDRFCGNKEVARLMNQGLVRTLLRSSESVEMSSASKTFATSDLRKA
jgi:hypothetical protein